MAVISSGPVNPGEDEESTEGTTSPLISRLRSRVSGVSDDAEGGVSTINELRTPNRLDPALTSTESAYRSKLSRLIAQFATDPDARIALFRLEPERWKGETVKGFVDRWDLNRFKTLEDLLETIEEAYGGKYWELKIQVPNEQGVWTYRGQARVHIAADPRPKKRDDEGADKSAGNNGGGQPFIIPSPDEKFVRLAMEAQDRKVKESAQILDLVKSQQEAQSKLTEGTLNRREKEISELRVEFTNQRREFEKKMEDLIARDRPDSSLVQHISGASLQSVERSQKDSATERERIVDSFTRERKELVERATDERRALMENHTREMQSIRDMHMRELDAERKAREADKQQLLTQVDFERRSRDNDKQQFIMQTDAISRNRDSDKTAVEERWKSQLDNQRTLFDTNLNNMRVQYENQINNMKTTADTVSITLKERVNLLESKLEDADKRVKEELDRRLHDAERSKPDPIAQMQATVQAVTGAAGMLGFSRQSDAPVAESPKSETERLLEVAHKTGLVDKGLAVLGKVAEVMRPQPQAPMQPPVIVNVPYNPATGQPMNVQYNPATGQPMIPMNPAMAMQQFSISPQSHAKPVQPIDVTQVIQEKALDGSKAPQPSNRTPIQHNTVVQPPQNQTDPTTINAVVDAFQQAMDSGAPVKEFAEQIVNTQPAELVKPILQDGVRSFQALTQQANPESPLLSVRGRRWLTDLFNTVGKLYQEKGQ